MKILVIGGSYFYGRVFVMQAVKEHDITVLNRGTYSMENLGVKQIKGDRRREDLWKSITEDYDIIVDFCAYNSGDIAKVLNHIKGNIKQYILISTVDVYKRGIKGLKTEDTPFEQREFEEEVGKYITGKVALEKEIVTECIQKGIEYTILRPAILYGPYNYAPRESVYIKLLIQNHIIPHINGATGKFQFVYIKDAAEAIKRCLLNKITYGQAYNLCEKSIITYDIFIETLKNVADLDYKECNYTFQQAINEGIPLPFPVLEEESELYTNEKSEHELKLKYTSFLQGLAKTYSAFKNVYI